MFDVAYHGAGMIGYSGAWALAAAGRKVLLHDINPDRVAEIQDEVRRSWPFATEPPRATSSFEETLPIPIHIVAVPTQRNGRPDVSPVMETVIKLAASWSVEPVPTDAMIVFESTLVPGTVDKCLRVLDDYDLRDMVNVAVAPRRDVFNDDAQFGLAEIPRIVAGVTPRCQERIVQLLDGVCPTIEASHYRVAEIVKPLENALLCAPLALIYDTVRKFPDIDIVEAVRLAGTHPRLPEYFVDLGVSGYCIPVAPRYLGDSIPTTNGAVTSLHMFDVAVASLLSTCHMVGFLGVRLKASDKSTAMSHAVRLAPLVLTESGFRSRVFAHDTVLTRLDLPRSLEWLPFDGIGTMDAVVVTLDLPEYRTISPDLLKRGALVLDGPGVWEDRKDIQERVDYRRVGKSGWLCAH